MFDATNKDQTVKKNIADITLNKKAAMANLDGGHIPSSLPLMSASVVNSVGL
jgi:hypothetical protein